jgi:hypothetical protein
MMMTPNSPATVVVAKMRFPFLWEHHREDVMQLAEVLRWSHPDGATARTAADRELYRLARDLGWRRDARGIPRGKAAPWVHEREMR